MRCFCCFFWLGDYTLDLGQDLAGVEIVDWGEMMMFHNCFSCRPPCVHIIIINLSWLVSKSKGHDDTSSQCDTNTDILTSDPLATRATGGASRSPPDLYLPRDRVIFHQSYERTKSEKEAVPTLPKGSSGVPLESYP